MLLALSACLKTRQIVETTATTAESAVVFLFNYLILLKVMAEWTGLEPVASRVTGGRYNQLNYHSVFVE